MDSWFTSPYGVPASLVGKASSSEAYLGPSGMDSMFSRLTNPLRGCDFMGNRGPAGLFGYFGIVIRSSKGFFGYYLTWIGIVCVNTK